MREQARAGAVARHRELVGGAPVARSRRRLGLLGVVGGAGSRSAHRRPRAGISWARFCNCWGGRNHKTDGFPSEDILNRMSVARDVEDVRVRLLFASMVGGGAGRPRRRVPNLAHYCRIVS